MTRIPGLVPCGIVILAFTPGRLDFLSQSSYFQYGLVNEVYLSELNHRLTYRHSMLKEAWNNIHVNCTALF